MSVSISYSQVNTVNMDGTYTVAFTITAATGVSSSLFSYVYGTSRYDHVSTQFDLATYPTSPSSSFGFYRQSTMSATFSDVIDAENAATNILAALQDTITTVGTNAGSFPGTTTGTIHFP